MIKLVRAFLDSEGQMHATREAACKAEFRRMVWNTDLLMDVGLNNMKAIPLDALVDAMFDIDRMIGEACKEDTRAEFAPSPPEEVG